MNVKIDAEGVLVKMSPKEWNYLKTKKTLVRDVKGWGGIFESIFIKIGTSEAANQADYKRINEWTHVIVLTESGSETVESQKKNGLTVTFKNPEWALTLQIDLRG